MRHRGITLAGLVVVAASVVGIGAAATADNGRKRVDERLSGFEEVPALSTPGSGRFKASIARSGESISWELSFGGTESDVTQAHIHFENATNNGPVVVFLCANPPLTFPPGTQPCPATGGTISGIIKAENVGAGAAGAGIGAGELGEFIDALRAGATYVNVHTVGRPGGEIRSQLAGSHSWHD